MDISIFEADPNLVTIRAERTGTATMPEPAHDCAVRLTIEGRPDAHLLRNLVGRWLDDYAAGG